MQAHSNRPSTPRTVAACIRAIAAEFGRHDLCFGHGTDNAHDEAAWLVFDVLELDHEDPAAYAKTVDDSQEREIRRLARRRVEERVPLAYLLGRAWFGGHQFIVNRDVLVPRSPIAELIDAGFRPWIGAAGPRRILDIGTGCGCIAIASALRFPDAEIDAADISEPALSVARRNVSRFALQERIRLIRSNLFDAIGNEKYDLIISNPPYVGADELVDLPDEYRYEPELGLASGADGLDSTIAILHDAAKFLAADGILVIEVGNSQAALERRFPQAEFIWLEFARGGSGVFLLTREVLLRHAGMFRDAAT